jgi:Flp pilus assembly protein CpaB
MLAIGLVLVAGALALTPPETSVGGVPVTVAARDLPIGAVLQPGDLRAAVSRDPPDGALDPAASLDGRVLAAPIRRGEVLTDVRLDHGAPDPGPGRAVVPVAPADPAVLSVLQPGARVAVLRLGTDPTGAGDSGDAVGTTVPLTDDALVLRLDTPAADGSGGPGRDDPAATVLLAVPEPVADAVVAATLTGTLALRLVR